MESLDNLYHLAKSTDDIIIKLEKPSKNPVVISSDLSNKNIVIDICPFSEMSIIDYSLNSNITIYAQKYSIVNFYSLQNNTNHKYQQIIKENAKVYSYIINTSNNFFNCKSDINLLEINASANFFVLDLTANNALSNTEVLIKHMAPRTLSKQCFRGVYANKSKGTFLGKVIIENMAKKSQATQAYKALILDKEARAHVKPQLEIYNDDIKASHGASIGELNKEALFYLCSRGLSINTAKSMLIEGFFDDILFNINIKELKNNLIELIKNDIHIFGTEPNDD